MQQKFIILGAPGGTTYNQLKDGSLRVFINPQSAARLKSEVLRFVNELDKYLISLAGGTGEIEPAPSVTLSASAKLPVAGLPAATVIPVPPGIPFNEDQAIAQTIVSGGFE